MAYIMKCDRCGAEHQAAFSIHQPFVKGRTYHPDWVTLTDAGGWEQYDLCPECVLKWHAVRSPMMKSFLADKGKR